MSSNDRAFLFGVLAVVTLAAIGAAVHMVPWLRDNRTDISLFLLMLLFIASGFTAALGLIAPYSDRSTPAVDSPDAGDAEDGADQDADMVCPQCGEPAHESVPTDLVPAHYADIPVPEWSHLDGTQLCPVIGPDGYRPVDPIRIRTSLPESSETP
jgi:hypothetical protein